MIDSILRFFFFCICCYLPLNLRDDDFDGDGFISYPEFLKAQKLREDQARAQQQQQPPQGQQAPPVQH